MALVDAQASRPPARDPLACRAPGEAAQPARARPAIFVAHCAFGRLSWWVIGQRICPNDGSMPRCSKQWYFNTFCAVDAAISRRARTTSRPDGTDTRLPQRPRQAARRVRAGARTRGGGCELECASTYPSSTVPHATHLPVP